MAGDLQMAKTKLNAIAAVVIILLLLAASVPLIYHLASSPDHEPSSSTQRLPP